MPATDLHASLRTKSFFFARYMSSTGFLFLKMCGGKWAILVNQKFSRFKLLSCIFNFQVIWPCLRSRSDYWWILKFTFFPCSQNSVWCIAHTVCYRLHSHIFTCALIKHCRKAINMIVHAVVSRFTFCDILCAPVKPDTKGTLIQSVLSVHIYALVGNTPEGKK